ncbi:MAG: hypothetical protein KF713_15680 [Turneriella sp.]|nr:hypothetical protein [Turneriella sp.]
MKKIKALIKSLTKNRPVEQLLVDNSEVSLDQVLESGIIRELPIIKNLVALTKAGIGLRDYLYMKRIVRFVQNAENITPEERDEFLKKYGSADFSDDLLLIIEKSDTLQKAAYIGKAFKALLKGAIELKQFKDLSHAINKANTDNLAILDEIYYPVISRRNPSVQDDLLQAGLLNLLHYDGLMNKQGTGYLNNDLGKLFITHCLEKPSR